MRRSLLLSLAALAAFMAALTVAALAPPASTAVTLAAPSGGCVVAATTTCTFSYTGAPEAWVVPAGVTSAVFDLYGGQGGNVAAGSYGDSLPGGAGGEGAHVQATLGLTPGATLYLRVGGQGGDGLVNALGPFTAAGGFNGGGTTSFTPGGGGIAGAGGGGSSDVRASGDALANRLLVAGGGGGASAGGANSTDQGSGGNSATAAKSVTGSSFSLPLLPPITSTCSGGGAGTLSGPGAAGGGDCLNGSPGDAGGLFGGGTTDFQQIGAGGGGYFGGGTGAASGPVGSGGGGGSDYVDPAATGVTVTDGVRTGTGLIIVTYTTPAPADTTAPSITVNSPSDGATYQLNQSVTADYSCADEAGGSGIASCIGSVAKGSAIDTSTVGQHTFTVDAADNAGNQANATVHYTVEDKVLGFFSPVPGSRWKAGTTVPVKIALADMNGVRISDADAAALSSPTCRVMFSASGAQTVNATCMRYDPTTHQFLFNWKLGRATGSETIKITISYPGTTTTTTKTEAVTLTK